MRIRKRRRRGGAGWFWLAVGLVLLALCFREGIFRLTVERISDAEKPETSASAAGIRAIWVTQYDQTGWLVRDGQMRSEEAFRASVRQAVQAMASAGLNTVFLQVRPFGDSFYPSALYPPGALAVGHWGGEFAYDPLAIWLEEAGAAGLALHGWINPFRAMRDAELLQVDARYAIRQWREDSALCGTRLVEVEGRWYLNPADPAVRELIAAGVAELLNRYPLAGIHLDDYFYPTTDPSFDAAAYAAAGAGQSLGDFRREQVNLLLQELHRLCQEAGVLFGVSPAGDPDACYNRDYADVSRWAREGTVDYLCPQLYWGFDHATHAFAELCIRWQSIAAEGNCPLLIGLTLEKAISGYDGGAGNGAWEWSRSETVLARCVAEAKALPNCVGTALFCYQYCFDLDTGRGIALAEVEREGYFAALNTGGFAGMKKFPFRNGSLSG